MAQDRDRRALLRFMLVTSLCLHGDLLPVLLIGPKTITESRGRGIPSDVDHIASLWSTEQAE